MESWEKLWQPLSAFPCIHPRCRGGRANLQLLRHYCSIVFAIRINSYFLDQIKEENDPMWRQVVPTLEELDDFLSPEELLESDPLNEEGDMPVPELVHRYPDRHVPFFIQGVRFQQFLLA